VGQDGCSNSRAAGKPQGAAGGLVCGLLLFGLYTAWSTRLHTTWLPQLRYCPHTQKERGHPLCLTSLLVCCCMILPSVLCLLCPTSPPSSNPSSSKSLPQTATQQPTHSSRTAAASVGASQASSCRGCCTWGHLGVVGACTGTPTHLWSREKRMAHPCQRCQGGWCPVEMLLVECLGFYLILLGNAFIIRLLLSGWQT
jgi:hypothetical protein